ncbi:MAG: C40 family peptidase [Candidatus Zixiibacteriota bacterium]
MKYAYVTTNLIDLWAEPRYNSERASQLLFAELVTWADEQDGFARVRQVDGYTGWVDARFLQGIDCEAYEKYGRAATWVVSAVQTPIMGVRKGVPMAPHYLYHGTRILIKRSRSLWSKGLLPDEAVFLVKSTAVAPSPVKSVGLVAKIVRESHKFLGVPYLWGGVSPAGFDCSGFVRAVFGRFGVYLPRDTKDQINAGSPVTRDEVRAGDLLFFKRHVGIALDNKRLIHASLAGGGVRINSLDANDPDYRADLGRDFNQARRVL